MNDTPTAPFTTTRATRSPTQTNQQVRDETAATTAEALVGIFADFGWPARVTFDNAPGFSSAVIDQLNELAQVERVHISPYHPKANSIAERHVGTVKAAITRAANEARSDWAAILPLITMNINTTVNDATRHAPSLLAFGREVRTPFDHFFGTQFEIAGVRVEQHLRALRRNLTEAGRVAEQHAAQSHDRNASRRAPTVEPESFRVGDLVLVRNETPSSADDMWHGPMKVIGVTRRGGVQYRPADGSERSSGISVANVDRVKRFIARSAAERLPDDDVGLDSHGRYTHPVAYIYKKNADGEFLAKFGGLADSFDTYVTADSLDPNVVKRFDDRERAFLSLVRNGKFKDNLSDRRKFFRLETAASLFDRLGPQLLTALASLI